MGDISKLEGINFEEIRNLRAAHINTVEDFLAQMNPDFNYGIMYVSQSTGIKPERVLELVSPKDLNADVLPNIWLESLSAKALDEAPPDYSWLKRKRFGAQRFWLGLKGNWLGWGENSPLFVPVFLLLIVVALAWRSLGGFQWLSSPFGLHDRVLIAADDMKSGVAPKASDFYPALLPPQSDCFRPGQNLDGLILARDISGQMPLCFKDVLRPQMVAAKDIQAHAIIQQEDAVQTWTVYQPGAALTLEEVCAHRTRRAIRKDAIILSEFVGPAK